MEGLREPPRVGLLKGLWERVIEQADLKVANIEATHERETVELQQKLDKYKANNQRWQQLFSQWQQEKSQLTNEKLVLEESESEKLQQQCIESEKLNNESLQAKMHWQQQYKDAQKMQETNIAKLVNMQSEIKMLSQQFIDAKQSLADTVGRNKLLSHEKWVLEKEKAQLEGQLIQMQKMMAV